MIYEYFRVIYLLIVFKGFYIKVAQIMGNRSDILPDIYIEKLRRLEDQVPHLLNPQQAKSFIVSSLGLTKFEDAFLDFQDEPIGSASIGQVHKATLKSTGKAVAIKIQGPGSEELFRMDIGTARDFCKVFAPEQVAIFDEIEKQFLTEFDYRAEAQNLLAVSNNMQKAGFTGVVVPKPYLNLVSKHVLTMEYLKGPKLVDGAREKGREYAKSMGKDYDELMDAWKKDVEANGLPPPYKGPNAFTLESYRKILQVKDGIINTPFYFVNAAIGIFNRLTGWKVTPYIYFKSFIPLNSSFLMDTILQAHGHQLLVDGMFNADPHPGNFLLMDGGSKIAMLDYGQVKRLTLDERVLIARMILAVNKRDEQAILQIYKETGYKSKYMNSQVMCKMLVVVLDQDGRDVCDGLNLQQFVDKMYALDPWEETADFMVMPIRLSILLRGIGLMLNHPVSVCTAWNDLAKKTLLEGEMSKKKH